MTIKFNEQIEREMEIEIPCYRTNGTFIVKVLGEHENIHVHVDGTGFSYHNTPFWGVEDYFKKGWSQATREEFEEAYLKFNLMEKREIMKHFDSVPENTF